MDAEQIFFMFFIGFVLFIPFSLGNFVGGQFLQIRLFRSMLPTIREGVGKVVGYTKGPANEGGDYFAIIEHSPNDRETVWAENSAQKHMDYAIGAEVTFSYHKNDPRLVSIGNYRYFMKGDKIFFGILVIFSLAVVHSLVNYFNAESWLPMGIYFSYIFGICWGLRFSSYYGRPSKFVKDTKRARDKRLSEAQAQGKVPCHLDMAKV